jgi:aryl-alcohol dehydrogenase-like predicted oxidoreductase
MAGARETRLLDNWLAQNTLVTSVIAGTSTLEQVKEDAHAPGWILS